MAAIYRFRDDEITVERDWPIFPSLFGSRLLVDTVYSTTALSLTFDLVHVRTD